MCLRLTPVIQNIITKLSLSITNGNFRTESLVCRVWSGSGQVFTEKLDFRLSKMSAPRQSCLFVLSSSNEGIRAQSFLQAYNIISSNFNVQLASPGGKHIEYVNQDESNQRWFNEFRAKSSFNPIALETVDAARYAALVIPDSPGAVRDLYLDQDLKQILIHFVKERKPICAIGMGVAGLFPAHTEGRWCFEDYSLTCTSLYELARNSDFPSLPVIPEDYIKDHCAKYSCSGEVDSVHVVIDRHVITGQNQQSTIMAVQNLILMCSQKTTGRLSPR